MYKRIMIVVDETEVTAAAVSEGIRIAAACGASVVFIHGSVVTNLITLSAIPVLVCKPRKRAVRSRAPRKARSQRTGSRVRQ